MMNPHLYTDLLQASIDRNAPRPCMHIKRDGTYRSWTYAEFGRDLRRLASALNKAGVGTGSNCVVIGQNTPEWAIAYHAIICAGGCVVPIDPNLPAAEIREILRLTDAMIVFCSPIYANLFIQLRESAGRLREIVILDRSAIAHTRAFREFLDTGDPDFNPFARAFSPDDPCAILFTSGTTGKAKGAVLTQRNFTAPANHGVPRMKVTPDDTMLAVLPLHHVFGFAAGLAAVLPCGLDVVFVPIVKGPLILEAIREKGVTILPAVPQMLELFYGNIMRQVRAKGAVVSTVFGGLQGVSASAGAVLGAGFRKKLFGSVHRGFGGSLRMFISGGSSLKTRYFHGFRQMGFIIVEGYGLTETFGPITLCPGTDARLGSVGPVLGANQIRLDAPDNAGIGEICFKGESVFAGYHNNPAATAAVFDADGWFHTGDLGRITKDGFVYITGRSKDIIVLDSGKNVYPDELEEYYSQSIMIEEIGIFGAMEKGSEIVAAVIVPSRDLRKGYSRDKMTDVIHQELIRIGKLLPTYKKIGSFVVSVQPLPRTSTRKIRKNELKIMYANEKETAGSTEIPAGTLSFLETALMASDEFSSVLRAITQGSPDTNATLITPRSHLEMDCKVDSLRKIDLVCAIENEYGIILPAEELVKYETVGDFTAFVQDMRTRTDSIRSGVVTDIKKRIVDGGAPGRDLRPNSSPLFHYSDIFINTLGRACWNLVITGKEHLHGSGPFIIAANHASNLDIVLLLSALPWEIRRNTYTLAKKELLSIPVLPALFRQTNVIPVERAGNVAEALATAISMLRNNKNLILFPEGTRTRTGVMGAFKSGVGTLLLETHAAILPVKITGMFDVCPPGKMPVFRGLKKRNVTFTFGEPLTRLEMMATGRISEKSDAVEIAGVVRGMIAGMCC